MAKCHQALRSSARVSSRRRRCRRRRRHHHHRRRRRPLRFLCEKKQMYEEYAALSLSCNNYYVECKDGDVTRRDLFNIPYIVPLSFLFFFSSGDFLAKQS